MATSVRELFRELADASRAERRRILDQKQLPADVRAEVESLLSFDARTGEMLTRGLSNAVEDVFRTEPMPDACGPYKLIELLGSGGMGDVYLAERHDGEIEQKVAIKFLRDDADRPVCRERFIKERQFLANLNHSSIARMLDAGHTEDGRPYLVMEHVNGVAIDKYAAALDLRGVLRLFLQVCAGVAHAHRHLIVHRDLKPSNILVDANGTPKLLDFGIAKLLDISADQTQTVERLLTPNYASPEQMRGSVQTTATDIYSLGAVLYRLLTGMTPRETPREVQPNLPKDVDHILRKALREEPHERYVSVDAFADDIRAFLESRPVQARSGDRWYRIRKGLRRHRGPVMAAAVTIASLSIGLLMANHERDIAQRRFGQVRHLANQVLLLDQVIAGLHNSTKARVEMVALSKEYLEGLSIEAQKDQNLALEVGQAYSLLARAQGVSVVANLGQRAQAEESLRKAYALVQPVLRSNPNHRKALMTAARISQDRMLIAESEHRTEDALAEAHNTVRVLNRILEFPDISEEEREAASEFCYHVALAHKNLHLTDEAISYAHRSIEIARSLSTPHLRLSMGLSLLADLLRITGELPQAFEAIREAHGNLSEAKFSGETARRSAWFTVLLREGRILGAFSGLSLNRPAEAIVVLREAFELAEGWTQSDRDNAWSRLYLASIGRELGDVLRQRDPREALKVYEHTLRRLGEVKDHKDARQLEAEIMAGTSYALRSLNRHAEAWERIEGALRNLRETGDYPAERVTLHEAADVALRALGDHLAATGEPLRAAGVYAELLDKVMAAQPDRRNDLRHALGLSQIYGSLAALHHRNGEKERAEEFAALRVQLWRHWDGKLPENAFVQRQLDSARVTP